MGFCECRLLCFTEMSLQKKCLDAIVTSDSSSTVSADGNKSEQQEQKPFFIHQRYGHTVHIHQKELYIKDEHIHCDVT